MRAPHDTSPPDSAQTPVEGAVSRAARDTINGPAFAALVQSLLVRLAVVPGPVAIIKVGEGRQLLAVLRGWVPDPPSDAERRRVLADVLAYNVSALDLLLTGGR